MGNCARNGSHIYSVGMKEHFWNKHSHKHSFWPENNKQQQLKESQITFIDKEHTAKVEDQLQH